MNSVVVTIHHPESSEEHSFSAIDQAANFIAAMVLVGYISDGRITVERGFEMFQFQYDASNDEIISWPKPSASYQKTEPVSPSSTFPTTRTLPAQLAGYAEKRQRISWSG